MNEQKKRALATIDERAALYEKIAEQIWENPELSLKEYKAAELYCETLRSLGFTVTEKLGGIDTAFCGSFGSGKPVIGILGEYDALSGLSQKAGAAEESPLVPGGAGHGCGHNLLGAGSLAAAAAVKDYLEKSGKDGTVLKVDKKLSKGQDIGYVGEVKEVNPLLLNTLLDNDFIPVICPIGSDDGYYSYNINADDAACAIAKAMKASKLVFLTDIEGVYRDPADKTSLISEMTVPEALEFLDSGNVGGGMLPKLANCIEAIQSGVSRVHILDGRIAHSLLLEFFTNKGIGTAIIGDEEERYYVEQ